MMVAKIFSGKSVANGVFHLAKNESKLLYLTMAYTAQLMSVERDSDWSSFGSRPLTAAFRHICNISPGEFAFEHVTGKQHFKVPF